jgi:transcription initiation factor TFIID subunit 2
VRYQAVCFRQNISNIHGPAIHSVTVASYAADFVQFDPFTNLAVSNAQDLHNHPELKRKIYSAYSEGEEGELSIALPKEVHLRQNVGSRAGSVVRESAWHWIPYVQYL